MWDIYFAITDAIRETGGEVKLGKDTVGGTIVDRAIDILAKKHTKDFTIKVSIE